MNVKCKDNILDCDGIKILDTGSLSRMKVT